MATTLDGGLVLLYYGDTDDIDDAKSIVCETDSSFDGSRTTNAIDTKCGILKSLGRQDNKISGNGVTNVDPGVMEGSFADLLELYRAGTKQFIWYKDPDDHIFLSGQGWFNSVGNQNKSGDLSTFSYTLEIDGDISTTAESPVSATFDTTLTFPSSTSDVEAGVTGTIDAGSVGEGLELSFNAITPLVGDDISVEVRVSGVNVITIDTTDDYAGEAFRFIDADGVTHTGEFADGIVNV